MAARDRRHRSTTAAGLALAVALLLAGCSDDDDGDGDATGTTAAPADTPTVVVEDRAFTPAEIEVDAGQAVTWRFEDGGTEHTVTGATFGSERLSSGTFEHTFDQPGTSTYRCTIHPDMQGRVVVS